MSIRSAPIKQLVMATFELIESAHESRNTRTRLYDPVPLSSATLTLVPLMVKDLWFDRGANLHVFTHANLTGILMAAMSHYAKMPVEKVVHGGPMEERDFIHLTVACGKLVQSQMHLVHAANAEDLLTLLAEAPAEAFILTDVPLSVIEMERMRELADTRRLTVIHYAMQSEMPAYRFW